MGESIGTQHMFQHSQNDHEAKELPGIIHAVFEYIYSLQCTDIGTPAWLRGNKHPNNRRQPLPPA